MDHDATSTTLLSALRHGGDPVSWSRFEQRYRPAIVAWCLRLGASPHDAEDVAQDVLVKLITKIGLYQREKGRFRSWLARISNNCWLDLLREQKRQLPPAWEELSEQFGEFVACEHDRELLEQAQSRIRARVNDTSWRAFCMVTYDEQPAEAVAQALATSKTAVYQAVYRVRELLKQELRGMEEAFS